MLKLFRAYRFLHSNTDNQIAPWNIKSQWKQMQWHIFFVLFYQDSFSPKENIFHWFFSSFHLNNILAFNTAIKKCQLLNLFHTNRLSGNEQTKKAFSTWKEDHLILLHARLSTFLPYISRNDLARKAESRSIKHNPLWRFSASLRWNSRNTKGTTAEQKETRTVFTSCQRSLQQQQYFCRRKAARRDISKGYEWNVTKSVIHSFSVITFH